MAMHEELLSMAQTLNNEVAKLQIAIQEGKAPAADIPPQLSRIVDRLNQLGHEAQGQVPVQGQINPPVPFTSPSESYHSPAKSKK